MLLWAWSMFYCGTLLTWPRWAWASWFNLLQLRQRHGTIMGSGKKHLWKGLWLCVWEAVTPSLCVWHWITMAAVGIKGLRAWRRPKQKLRKIMEAVGPPAWQHWRHLLYHIQNQEMNIISEYSVVPPGSLRASYWFAGQQNRNRDDAHTVGDRAVMVMWEVVGVLLPSGTGRHLGVRTKNHANRHRKQLVGLLLILTVCFVGARSWMLCEKEIWCHMPHLVLSRQPRQPACVIQSIPLWCSPGTGTQIYTFLTCPTVLAVSGTFSNSSPISHGRNLTKNADTE